MSSLFCSSSGLTVRDITATHPGLPDFHSSPSNISSPALTSNPFLTFRIKHSLRHYQVVQISTDQATSVELTTAVYTIWRMNPPWFITLQATSTMENCKGSPHPTASLKCKTFYIITNQHCLFLYGTDCSHEHCDSQNTTW